MSQRPSLAAAVALALFLAVPSAVGAQNVTADFYDARLSEIVRNFAVYSGRTIVLAPPTL